jgi:hypothetical protein
MCKGGTSRVLPRSALYGGIYSCQLVHKDTGGITILILTHPLLGIILLVADIVILQKSLPKEPRKIQDQTGHPQFTAVPWLAPATPSQVTP